jgi:hypothetical protein
MQQRGPEYTFDPLDGYEGYKVELEAERAYDVFVVETASNDYPDYS